MIKVNLLIDRELPVVRITVGKKNYYYLFHKFVQSFINFDKIKQDIKVIKKERAMVNKIWKGDQK